MSTVRDQIGQEAMEVMHDLEETRKVGRDITGEKLEQAPDTDLDSCERLRGKVAHTKHGVQQFIRDLPVKSVLIALGAGVLLGRFWTIRRR